MTDMNEAIPTQHPAVVLRSQYKLLRALLAVAMIAVVGLTVAVVILATQNGGSSTSAAASSQVSSPAIPDSSQTGATLDHRGLNTTSAPLSSASSSPSPAIQRKYERGLH